MSQWQKMLEHYSDEEIERLEAGAIAQAERIEAAALDPTNNSEQDGIDIAALWFAVVRRREQLLAQVEPEVDTDALPFLTDGPPPAVLAAAEAQAEAQEAPESPVEAPEEPVEAEDAPSEPDEPEAAEEAPADDAPVPAPAARKPRATRAKK
jgi:hypothetical protein